MGSSVFGNAVTAATLRAMPEYESKNTITQQDRAKVALEKVNVEGKAVEARELLEKLQFRYGNEAVSTKCLIYNATGDNMTFVIARDWNGRLCEAAYPVIVANGQWGAFLHGNYCDQSESSRAGIVYSAFNNQGKEQHWFMGFSNSISGPTNHVYAEIREPGHHEKDGM